MGSYYGNKDDETLKHTLYKKNGNKVQQWTIEVGNMGYRTSEGFVGGAITTSAWTETKPKNVGRSNATTAQEQASIEADAKIKLKVAKGYTQHAHGIADQQRFEPMLAHNYKDHLKKIAPYIVEDNTCLLGLEAAVFSQPKLDGMRCNAMLQPLHQHADEVVLYSRQGKEIKNAGHIAIALTSVLEANPSVTIDGELYNHDLKDDFNTLISHVRKSKPTQEDKESAKVIQYHIYDMYDSERPEMTFIERQEWIAQHLQSIPGLILVRTDAILTQAFMDEYYALYREQGYEGQMIRLDCAYEQKRSSCLLKRKEFQDAEYEILDIIEGIGNRAGGMGKFVLTTGTQAFESNSLGDMLYYKLLLDNKDQYIGRMATVRFQNLTPRGVPRFPIVTTIRDYE